MRKAYHAPAAAPSQLAYVVVYTDPPATVTVAVTVSTTGAGGDVQASEAVEVAEGAADALDVVEPPDAMAAALNASNVLSPSVGGFTAKTIP